MEVVWGSTDELRPKKDWLSPPIMELIRDAVATSRITRRPIEKVLLTKKEKSLLDKEVDFANMVISKDSIMGVELEVCDD